MHLTPSTLSAVCFDWKIALYQLRKKLISSCNVPTKLIRFCWETNRDREQPHYLHASRRSSLILSIFCIPLIKVSFHYVPSQLFFLCCNLISSPCNSCLCCQTYRLYFLSLSPTFSKIQFALLEDFLKIVHICMKLHASSANLFSKKHEPNQLHDNWQNRGRNTKTCVFPWLYFVLNYRKILIN